MQQLNSFISAIKPIAYLTSFLFASLAALLTFGANYKNLPERVAGVETSIKDLNKDRSADREILIRIDERLKRFESKINNLKEKE